MKTKLLKGAFARVSMVIAKTSLLLALLLTFSAQAQYVFTNMAAGAGTNWSTSSSWKNPPGQPASGGSSSTVIHLQAQGNADEPAMLLDNGLAANNGFMLNALVLTNTAANNRGFTLLGSNLVFMSNAGVPPMIIGNSGGTGNGNGFTINNTIVLSNSLTFVGIDNGGQSRRILGVIAGIGDITNSVVNGNNQGCLQINNTANTFVGNWVLTAGIVQFAAGDGTIGSVSNGVTLMNNAQFQMSNPTTWNVARTLTIGSGGGIISSQASSRALTLTNTTSLAGSDLLTIGANGSLTLSANQVNFNGPVQVGGFGTGTATLTLTASNALSNAARIVATNYGLVNLNNPFGAGSLTVTNLANSQTTLGTNLVASGGTTIYLNDLSSVSGTDARLNTLTSGGNLIIAPASAPMVIHADANGTAVPSGVNRSSLVYGITANRGDLTIGDADVNQWRGVGVGMGSAITLGATSSNLTLNGNAELDALVGGTLTINSLITGGDATKLLAVRGPGTVTINNVNNNFASRIFGAGGTTLNANTAGTMTLTLANTNNAFAAINNNLAGTLNLTLSGSSNTIGSISGAIGSVVNLNGIGSTTVANALSTTGQLIKVTSGTVTLGTGRGTTSDLQIDGGILQVTNSRLGLNGRAALAQTLTITGGQVLVPSTSDYGVRINGDNGSTSGGTANNLFTGTQTGGVFSIFKGGANTSFSMGSTSAETNTYNLQGGLLNILGASTDGRIDLGSDTAGTGKTTFNFSGGKLVVNSQIAGSQGTGARQAFVWTGGTLATAAYIAANLTSIDGAAYAGNVGTLVNAGGVLAPGDIGTAGKTTVTGNYSNAPTATLAVDLGGATVATAFTNAGAYYDLVAVSGAAVVAGRLSVGLINGYVPIATNKFTVLTSTGLSGAFANVTAGKVWCADGYSRFDVLTNATANAVVLSNYVINAWSPTSGNAWTTGANWSLAEANGSGMAAYFGTGSSGTVTLDTARTVRGLAFNNGSASYTLSGSASLTLQSDTLTTPKLSVTAGNHTINVPLALSNATEIAVAASSVLTLSGNVTGSQNVTKTGTGMLVLSASNTLGALNISAGTVKQTAGTTTLTGLTLAGGTYDLWAGTLLIAQGVAGGAIDTIAEVEAAITAGTIKGRGQIVPVSEFKISVVDGTVKVELKKHGTMICFQ